MAGSQEAFQQAMNQGHSAAWDQSWDRAATFYRKALLEFPDNPQALTSLGLALVELQEYEEALQAYQKAARGLPQDPLPLEKMAQLSERLGNLDLASQASLRAAELYLANRDVNKAVENWERVTRLNPENLQAHSRLALVYERLGEKHKAVREYLATASLYQSGGNLEKATQAVTQALKVIPTSEEANQALGFLKDFRQLPRPARPRGATAPLRMSQVRQLQAPEATAQPELDPVAMTRQKALTVLASLLFESPEEEENTTSRKGLQAIIGGSTGNLQKPIDRTRIMLHLSQVVDLQTRGESAQAIEELQRAVDYGLTNAAAQFDLGYLYAQTGRLESALRHLQHSVKHADFALGSRLLLGDLLHKKGQIRDASLEYLEALKMADAQAVPAEQANDLIQLYDLLIEAHRQKASVETQERLCSNIYSMLMRSDWRAQIRRAREQLPGQGLSRTAIPLAELLTEARSGQAIESVSVIYEMMSLGQYRSAMEEAYRALLSAPTYLPLHALMGEMLVKQREPVAAVAKFQVIARTYASRGDAQQAINFSRKVVELIPTDLNARGRLIEQLIAFGKIETAIEEYIQLAEVHYSLADLALARKTYTEALRTGQQANVDRALRVRILHRMADIDVQSLDWRQALRVLEQIRTLQPDDTQARAQIIRLNFRLGQEQQSLSELDNYMSYLTGINQHTRLAQFIEDVVEERPDNIPVRRRLSDLYRQMGNISAAVSQLDAIGEILLQAGERTAAIQTVEMILSLDPVNKAEYQQILEQLRN
jgi:tetratricopeptide (TPR) repeat protein